MKAFVPQRFHGNVLLFVAAEDKAKPSIEVWRRYVDGHVHVHRIACTHEAMMDALPVAEIGEVLAIELDKQRMSAVNTEDPDSDLVMLESAE